ncbi:MAG TPA: Uma2 family endonuclease [Leptospiraceae bacterium]|nr:Uma2 family endonuclease [Leptospiraceae bacterium]HRG74160.1 Uma2 family endonuclease [Leptospiraceae bacterium]
MSLVLENPNLSKSLYEFTIEKYHELSESGLLPRNLELVFGGIVKKVTISPIHAILVNSLRDSIIKELPVGYFLRQESPLTIESLHSEPEPDLAILKGKQKEFISEHPTTALWVIEVSNTTVDLDRAKKKIYATANVPVYWIINLATKEIEIYTNPKTGEYKEEKTYSASDLLPMPQPLTISIRLSDFL